MRLEPKPPQPNWHFQRTQSPVTTSAGRMTLAQRAPRRTAVVAKRWNFFLN